MVELGCGVQLNGHSFWRWALQGRKAFLVNLQIPSQPFRGCFYSSANIIYLAITVDIAWLFIVAQIT